MPHPLDQKNEPEETLLIQDLAFGGDGLARYEEGHPSAGKVVFVRGGLPGEKVSAVIEERRKDFDRGLAVGILEPSPDRVTPACPLFGSCGGCQLQHLGYPAQVEAKTAWARQFAARAGVAAERVRPAVPSPREFGYRFRVRLRADPLGRLGFSRAGSTELVRVDHCPVMSPELNSLADRISRLLADRPPGCSFELELGALAENGFVLVRPPASGQRRTGKYIRRLRKITENLRARLSDSGIGIYFFRPGSKAGRTAPPQGSLALAPEEPNLTLFPGVFAQAQLAQNSNLIKAVLDSARVRPGDRVLDLMAGMGNLSLPLARAGARVRAVETDPLACANGTYNAREAGLEVDFRAVSAEKAVEDLLSASRQRSWEVIVADPPRRGLKGLTEALAGLQPKRLVYVSCNPPTLARDLTDLGNRGYRVEMMTPLDLFPQTFHLETVCLLVRS